MKYKFIEKFDGSIRKILFFLYIICSFSITILTGSQFLAFATFIVLTFAFLMAKKVALNFSLTLKEIGFIFKMFLLGLVVNIGLNFIIKIPVSQNQQFIVEALKDPRKALTMGIFVAIIAPLVEEIFFRGILQEWFNGVVGKKISIIIVAFMFAAPHLTLSIASGTTDIKTLLLELVPYFTLALVFCYSYYKTQRLAIPIYLHILNNSYALVIIILFSNSV